MDSVLLNGTAGSPYLLDFLSIYSKKKRLFLKKRKALKVVTEICARMAKEGIGF
jgi:hypothetical protein